ncbi:DUF433 domain-containing protein [Pedobacter changchengzhani]|uniref:DUF433 domain-containing protein n=1 Tax=Pedobacter changchengzhani TaxID=2529274 RepID=A0A4R5MIE9_9SPHI|nr:DUF433 domain-containing protein [Pedobacter changchengzhani]TDG35367.1 DUF433 domain-containing protein [Pedobacter changchengzhani]
MKTFENKLKLGNGIYTVKEISQILRVPYHKINLWITKYWDGELGKAYEQNYSWKVADTKAVGFHTLVEFYVMMQFAEAGVKIREVLNAHKELASINKSNFPFATKAILENIKTDGKKIFLSANGDTITLDGTKQLNLDFINLFFRKLDFDEEKVASRFWPLGKEKEIVCDPHHKFGQAVIGGTNIQAEAIYMMYLAKEPIDFIAELYELSKSEVQHAIEFYKTAA